MKPIPFFLIYVIINLVLLSQLNIQADSTIDVAFPDDVPVWNVRDYGAKGDGVADDTQAIQSAISAALNAPGRYGRGGASQIVYIPNGVYKISGTLQNVLIDAGKTIWHLGFYLQGQSQTSTILKLSDGCPGFIDPIKAKPVIQTRSQNYQSGAVDQAFGYYIRNLTVDTGTGNPGAIGIDFIANNRGGIFDVTVRSNDPAGVGYTGITMDAHYPGPALLKNVTVHGFSTGISMRYVAEYGMTLEHIFLDKQLTYGLFLGANALTIRDLKSHNKVPGIYNVRGFLTVLDGTFEGGDASQAAIVMTGLGQIYCRNLTTSGYGTVVSAGNTKTGAGNGETAVHVAEFETSGPFKAFPDDSNLSLGLPVRETPDFNTLDVKEWANAAPQKDLPDYLASIQTAIDSGKSIVYLPSGTYPI